MVIGFGGVGQAFASIVNDLQQQIKNNGGPDYRLVAIADLHKGWAYNEQGLNISELLETNSKLLQAFSGDAIEQTFELIRKSKPNVIAEASYTTHDGEPAISYFKEALASGAHVVTTNKGPIALASSELENLAQEHDVSIGAEGTVMSGTPVLSVLDNIVQTSNINRIRGIFNGTCNYILTQMGQGMDYTTALKQAQQLGFAEAEPKNDVEGWDVAMKMLILAKRYMGGSATLKDLQPEGINQLSAEDIARASEQGKCWKLVGQITKQQGVVDIRIKPELLGADDPLASINGAVNAVNVECDYLGSFTISGPGAGLFETGYSLWSDMHRVCTA